MNWTKEGIQDGFSQIPLMVGSMFGHRCFSIMESSPILRSWRDPTFEWAPGERQAACCVWGTKHPDHKIANAACTCGLYAYFNGVNDYMTMKGVAVEGIIEAWGSVVYGTRGFRASKARIVALAQPPAMSRVPWPWKANLAATWRQVEARYALAGVPVFASLADALDAFPLTDHWEYRQEAGS